MSEQQTESPEPEGTKVEADQVVVNNAPDGGGVDNEAAPQENEADDEDGDKTS